MGAEGELPPQQRKRKRSPGPRGAGLGAVSEPRAKRGPGGTATTAPNTQNTALGMPPSPARPARGAGPKRVGRLPDDGPNDANASSSASDVPPGEAGSAPAIAAMVYVCGH